MHVLVLRGSMTDVCYSAALLCRALCVSDDVPRPRGVHRRRQQRRRRGTHDGVGRGQGEDDDG